MAAKVYPEWVQAQKRKGTAIKKVGGNYYLYKHSSKRVPGKKYPVPVDTYIGTITPDGVIESKKKKLALTSAEVWEYGFSKAIWALCPEDWKKPLGNDWEDVLSIITLKWSPYSYLAKRKPIRAEGEFHYQFAAQMGSLSRRIHKSHGVTMDELHKLDRIYLICIGKEEIVSMINPEQKQLLERLQVNLGLC